MSEPRIIVWHDVRGTNKWIVALEDGTGRQINAVPYDREDDAMASAKMIEKTRQWPLYRRGDDGRLGLIKPH